MPATYTLKANLVIPEVIADLVRNQTWATISPFFPWQSRTTRLKDNPETL